MGNYKFKFSDMIPNAWFYKLKYISRTKNQNSMQKTKKKNHPITKSPTFSTSSSATAVAASPQLNYQRKSYHFTRDLPPTPHNNSASQLLDTPRRSSKKRRSIKKSRPLLNTPRLLVTSSVSTDCSCTASVDERQNFPPATCSSEEDNSSVFPELGSENGDKPFDKIISTCHCRLMSDIPYGITMTKDSKLQNFDSFSQFELRPIITKTDKVENNEEVCNMRRIGTKTEERISYSCSKEQRIIRKLSANNNISTGVKLRTNSPRIASKRFVQVHHRKSVSSGNGGGKRRSLAESFAVVKTSKDPHKDFKESMVEMIMENNIRSSKDLEDLLACYLTLNSDKYHDMIIKVFKQIWFEITDVRY